MGNTVFNISDIHGGLQTPAEMVWLEALGRSSSPHETRFLTSTSTRAGDLKFDGEVVCSFEYQSPEHRNGKMEFVWQIPGALVRVEETLFGDKRLRVRILTEGPGRAREVLGIVQEQIKPLRATKNTEVKMKFWRFSPHGGTSFVRNIEAPRWNTIQNNYSPAAAAKLGRLMRLKPSGIGTGKVVVITGPPGTGKTTSIRSLAREWKKWCEFSYAIDPEQVFGNADYLTTIIANGWDDDDEMSFEARRYHKWRLLVIEDAEEFLVPNAKQEVGQAVARLLNVGDGILGQGLKLLVLLSTNQPLEKLSAAITRPGRCLANIEVPKLTKSYALDWLEKHNKPTHNVPGDMTLAELWERVHPSQISVGTDERHPGQYL